MSDHASTTDTMRTLRFHEYGEPGNVLRLDTAAVTAPGPGHIRVTVQACGLSSGPLTGQDAQPRARPTVPS